MLKKISVITTTYMHGQDVLKRAVNSVLMQQSVNFEHIIIDDSDKKNGMMISYRDALSRCSGDYIAFCDGDDYWIDPYKLKKQYDYMEGHPECGLCITKVYSYNGNDVILMPSAEFVNKNMSFDTLLKGRAYIHAQSYFLRKSVYDQYIDFDSFVKKFNVWDYPIVLELIKHTNFHCLDFYSAVNTINKESVTHTRSRLKRLKYIYGSYKIKLYYIKKYGCKLSTAAFLVYRAGRHILSIGLKRWK